jgi:hypothetical protein
LRVRSCLPPPEALNVWAVKMGSSCAQFVPRAPSGAVDIVHEIALLSRAPFYSAGCSICWSINLRLPRAKLVTFLDTARVTAHAGDALKTLAVSLFPKASIDENDQKVEASPISCLLTLFLTVKRQPSRVYRILLFRYAHTSIKM